VANATGKIDVPPLTDFGHWQRFEVSVSAVPYLTLPYLTFGVGRLLHLPSAEAVSVRPNAQPRCNQVTVIGYKAETSAVKPNKSPATWDW